MSIGGIIIDIVLEEKPKDNICKVKLIDQTLSVSEYVQIHIFIPKSSDHFIKDVNIGDIMIAQAVSFKTYNSKPQGIIDNHLGGFAIYNLRAHTKIVSMFQYKEENITYNKIESLENWAEMELLERNLATCFTMPNLAQCKKYRFKYVDLFAYVVRVERHFPEDSYTTMILCDGCGYGLLEVFDFLVPKDVENKWVKIREVKVMGCMLKAGKHTAINSMYQDMYNITMQNDYLPGLNSMKAEALRKFQIIYEGSLCLKPTIVTSTFIEAPLMTEEAILNPQDASKFCRLKCLMIDFQPRDPTQAFSIDNDIITIEGCLIVSCMNSVLEIAIYGSEALRFFEISSNMSYIDILEKLDKSTRHLTSGNRWLELGIYRSLSADKIQLSLVRTRITF